MNLQKYLSLVAILLLCVGCPNDDDGAPGLVPIRDRGEQSIEDDLTLRTYLETHFYNYEEFEAGEEGFDYIVTIDTIAGENSDKDPILSRPELQTITYDRFGASNTLYVLKAREGGTPGGNVEETVSTYADSIFLNYQGRNLIEGDLFDGTANPIWLNLPATIDGFARGLEGFKGDPDGPTVNSDGTVTYENFGSGVIFIPSGLAYFSQPPAGSEIQIYGSLTFNFQMFDIKVTDHDGDFIKTIDEDLDNNEYLFDDIDNTDGDAVFNFRDPDDDNDGVLTRLEIVTEGEGEEEVFVSFLDTDGDGVSDYLDTDDDGDGRPTVDEIIINQATLEISYPDSDGDGTPDYLDSDS